MVNYDDKSYRQGEIILGANYRIEKEIKDTLLSLNITHGERKERAPESPDPHKVIVDAFKQRGWVEYSVSKLLEEEKIDLFKDRVAIEVEFSRREFLYRDYLRFAWAYNEDRIDVGVIITLSQGAKKHYLYDSVRPDIDYAAKTLDSLKSVVTVPIWIIGVH